VVLVTRFNALQEEIWLDAGVGVVVLMISQKNFDLLFMTETLNPLLAVWVRTTVRVAHDSIPDRKSSYSLHNLLLPL
jgi:hypothetical protein